MDFKGTKGKWYVSRIDEHDIVSHNCGCHSVTNDFNKKTGMIDIWFSDIHIVKSKEEALSNALLISKAPEMLEMLQLTLVELETGAKKHWEIYGMIEQLIKEATELKS